MLLGGVVSLDGGSGGRGGKKEPRDSGQTQTTRGCERWHDDRQSGGRSGQRERGCREREREREGGECVGEVEEEYISYIPDVPISLCRPLNTLHNRSSLLLSSRDL